MNVKRAEADDRMVLLVTEVSLREALKVSWARYHSGAICRQGVLSGVCHN
jgi:hypothetical protein